MSLVNDMLKDLERRRRMPVGHSNTRIAYSDDEDGSGSSKLKLIGVIVVVGIVSAAGASYTLLKRSVPQAAPQTVQTVAETPLVARAAEPATETVTEAVVESLPQISARIAGERNRGNGLELRIETSEKVGFQVVEKTDSRLTVLLTEVTQLQNNITSLADVSMVQVPEGLQVVFELPREADFVVYENSNEFTHAINIEAFWKILPEVSEAAALVSQSASADPDDVQVQSEQPAVATPAPARSVARAETPAATSDRNTAPLRMQRALTLQERDRNASQMALREAQSGQMQSAFASLYEFISENPEAHQSRNTLITLLFAQQQYDQVGMLVREGLLLAPNHSSYKKMKARLLMMQGERLEAISLLRNVPPAVAEDKEYFELLASLYQQTGRDMDAVSVYQDLIRTDASIGRWWAGMGISHEALGNVREAVNSFEVALQAPSLESSLRQYSRNRIKILSGQ